QDRRLTTETPRTQRRVRERNKESRKTGNEGGMISAIRAFSHFLFLLSCFPYSFLFLFSVFSVSLWLISGPDAPGAPRVSRGLIRIDLRESHRSHYADFPVHRPNRAIQLGGALFIG